MDNVEMLSMASKKDETKKKGGGSVALIGVIILVLCGGGWYFYDDIADVLGISSSPPAPRPKPKPKQQAGGTNAQQTNPAGTAASSLALDRRSSRRLTDFVDGPTQEARDYDQELGKERDTTVGRISRLYAEQEELKMLYASMKLRSDIRKLQRDEELAEKKHLEELTPQIAIDPPKDERKAPPKPVVETPKEESSNNAPRVAAPQVESILKITDISGSGKKMRATIVTQKGVRQVRAGLTVGNDFIVNINRDGMFVRDIHDKSGGSRFIPF